MDNQEQHLIPGKVMVLAALVMILLFGGIGLLAREAWTEKAVISTLAEAGPSTPNVFDGGLTQVLGDGYSRLEELTLFPRTAQEPSGNVLLTLSQDGKDIMKISVNTDRLVQEPELRLAGLSAALDPQKESVLILQGSGTGVVCFGMGAVGSMSPEESGLVYDGEPVSSRLAVRMKAYVPYSSMMPYWLLSAGLILAVELLLFISWRRTMAGKTGTVWHRIEEMHRYAFLISRLVSRDFTTKYRQSVLGVLWSVLNPLLTMAVMFFVFSTLFRSSVEHYASYLLSGICLWNFFVEGSTLGLESVTGNAAMITRVYAPRYIYPLTRCISALINFSFTLLPLIMTCLLDGLPVTGAWILLPVPVLCVFLFTCGMSLLLSTANVFFRDTRFLWSVLSMLWTYMTPIFYTEEIIPEAFRTVYHMNPMYQFLTFFRSILVHGIIPQPAAWGCCAAACLIPLVLGYVVFMHNQKKFVLYL